MVVNSFTDEPIKIVKNDKDRKNRRKKKQLILRDFQSRDLGMINIRRQRNTIRIMKLQRLWCGM